MKSFLFLMFAPLVLVMTAAAIRVPHNQDDRIPSIPGQGPLFSANYGGYIDVSNDRKAYYYMVESENDPTRDPVVLWLSGGPGCSSMSAMYTAMGPYLFRDQGKLVPNGFRWTTNATMIWLDSPAGVGFSIDPHINTTVWTDADAATYNYEFLKGFFGRYPHFRNNKFYIAGESYAGHYVPQLAEKIYDGDDASLRAQMNGWMVGNPCTGDIGCYNPDPTLEPFLQYNGFHPLDPSIKTANADYDTYDLLAPTCVAHEILEMARQFRYGNPHLKAAREKAFGPDSYNDGNKEMLPPPPVPYDPCHSSVKVKFLNRLEVKNAIHADPSIVFKVCTNDINYPINRKGVVYIYEKLMAKTNWSIILYSGTADSVVNFAQTQKVINDMNMPLANPEYSPWYYPDLYTEGGKQLGGFYLQYKRMSWAGVRGAGHMVPTSNPPSAKELFTSFLTIGRPGRLGN